LSDARHIVVLSDLHANGRALEAAWAQAERSGFDDVVVLGDLLTYGPDIDAVLDHVADLQARRGAKLLLGNHDYLYLDLAEGNRGYYERLPDWLKESIDWTFARLDLAAFRDQLAWQHEVSFGQVYLSHANPFGVRDFSYLNTDAELIAAAQALAARGSRAGVFGHTHRALLAAVDSQLGSIVRRAGPHLLLDLDAADEPAVINAGSIGQPRGGGLGASFLRIELSARQIDFELCTAAYDVQAHTKALHALELSEATTNRLLGFFR
jgi:predicted phosphodiesterase